MLLVLFVVLATETNDGVRDDLGRAATAFPTVLRQLVLAAVQPLWRLPGARRRRARRTSAWRRLAMLTAAALAGALLWTLVDAGGRDPRRCSAMPGAVADTAWPGALRSTSLTYLAGAMALAGRAGCPTCC